MIAISYPDVTLFPPVRFVPSASQARLRPPIAKRRALQAAPGDDKVDRLLLRLVALCLPGRRQDPFRLPPPPVSLRSALRLCRLTHAYRIPLCWPWGAHGPGFPGRTADACS